MAAVASTPPKPVTMIGPKKWRNATVKNLRVSQTMIKKADRKACFSRQADPLPTFRDNSTIHVNDKIMCYMRQTRGVVVKMHEVLNETNDEIKRLIKSKEDLEQALEHVRKDKLTNKHSVEIRTTRPKREKVRATPILYFHLYVNKLEISLIYWLIVNKWDAKVKVNALLEIASLNL